MSAESENTSGGSGGGVVRAPLNRPWLIKISVILVALLAFGAAGVYDATIKYPARGQRYASWAQWQYLQALGAADQEDFGIFSREASVADPVMALSTLKDKETLDGLMRDAGDSTSRRHRRAVAKVARKRWLDALAIVGRLKPEFTKIDSPRAKIEELNTEWSSVSGQPKGLHGYDIPSQWIIMIVCWGFAAWLIFLLLKTMGKKYSWDADAKKLSIPGGHLIAASDLSERLDKRKWDKFIVWADIKKDHTGLGGKRVRFDTYRHANLEAWLLAMEEEAFGPEEEGEEGE